MQRQIIYNLVESDTAPETPVRFVGLDLRDYTSIVVHVQREDSSRFVRPLSKHLTDHELGFIGWNAADLTPGRHTAEFLLTTATGKESRLPKTYIVIFNVRRKVL